MMLQSQALLQYLITPANNNSSSNLIFVLHAAANLAGSFFTVSLFLDSIAPWQCGMCGWVGMFPVCLIKRALIETLEPKALEQSFCSTAQFRHCRQSGTWSDAKAC